MKIVYFSPHPHLNLSAPSGPGTHMREIIKAFEHRGHTVVRFIAGGEKMDEKSPIVFKRSNIKKIIPRYIWQSLKDWNLLQHDKNVFSQLEQIILKEKPDLVYERGYYLMTAGVRAANKCGVRHFIELNAPYPEEKSQMEGASCFLRRADKIEKYQILHASLVVTVSTALKAYFIKRSNVDQAKILVTPNAVNGDVIATNAFENQVLRDQLGFAKGDTVIGFVGSIFPYHGVDELIQAFIQVLKKKDTMRLLIVGDGEILMQLKELVRQAKIEDKVVFTGNIPHREVFDYIRCMDIAVMAKSNWYGSPVKIFEYGAMAKLIIAPDEIPVHDVMEHGVHGFILGRNERALTPTLMHIVEHPEQARQLATAFYNKVKEHHTWQHVGDTILDYCK